MGDPVTGVISREQLRALAAAPSAGFARDVIRNYDPLWGLPEGAPLRWRITLTREVVEEGEAFVEAASEEEARARAAHLDDDAITWGIGWCDPVVGSNEVIAVAPSPARPRPTPAEGGLF